MSKHAPGIYVEILIRGTMEDLWEKTQNPKLHKQWDLRFNRIEYLPKADASAPKQFLYATRIGFGLEIQGGGESVGDVSLPNGQRTSALKFWSNDWKSLIREGSGYWKYTPTANGIRFETGYDYQVRFGRAGELIDRFLFRPLIGWATAWSFDRLRLWVEQEISPADTMRSSVKYAAARILFVLSVIVLMLHLFLLWSGNDTNLLLIGASPALTALASVWVLQTRALAIPIARHCRRQRARQIFEAAM